MAMHIQSNQNNEESVLSMDPSLFDVWMMQKRRRPLGERAGQSLDCPSELAQFFVLK
jgi:hypothetical protein